MARHGGHQFPCVIVVDSEGLVGAGGGAVDARPVQHHLDQGPVLAARPLESLGLLGARHAVHADVTILASCKYVLP